jgi:hypothetical protein
MVLAERYAGMKQPRKEKKEEKKMCVWVTQRNTHTLAYRKLGTG